MTNYREKIIGWDDHRDTNDPSPLAMVETRWMKDTKGV